MNRTPLSLILLVIAPFAAAQEHWVATWAASPQANRPFARPGAPAPPASLKNQTIRMVARASIAGTQARLHFSNAFGTGPVKIGAAHVALHAKASAIEPSTDKALQFGGKPSITIPPGATVVSDPIALIIPRFGDLAVSIYLPDDTGPATAHSLGLHTTYISKEGDATSQAELTDAATAQSWYFLSAVDVLAPAAAFAIVTFGDSITDGATSTLDTDRSWPSVLAHRLPATVAVVNHGISGNQVLRDGAGVNALARFDRDVLATPGVKWLTIMESINDIGTRTRANTPPADAIAAEDLIAALHQMVERAHMHGIKVAGCTLTPYEGAAYYSDSGEEIRQVVNRWIRTSGAFDAVIDFDAVTRDPEHPGSFRAAYNNNDHLHPNDAGYKAMAEAIDVSIFKTN